MPKYEESEQKKNDTIACRLAEDEKEKVADIIRTLRNTSGLTYTYSDIVRMGITRLHKDLVKH